MLYDYSNKTIFTDRLLLRLFQLSDAESVVRLCDNYNLYKSTLNLPYPYSPEDATSWIAHHLKNFNSDKSYELAVTDRQTGELYGAIALSNNQTFRHGELAYWIGEEYWGKGYATEAAEAVIRFAFEEKKYHKVFARYFQSNPASGRVMEKLGMKEEGILVDHVLKEGRYESLVCYGLINPAER
ncbi:GNAT family N-acetyltransferase [Bacillus infantis]|uniref:GNAT family N-acetyltransferase n=1 Tax=Bacillus infantis TaxID=324767 RepID=UPI003CECDBA6